MKSALGVASVSVIKDRSARQYIELKWAIFRHKVDDSLFSVVVKYDSD